MKVQFLKANNGDSILLCFVDGNYNKRNILIDGGTGSTYQFKNKKGKLAAGDLKKTVETIASNGEHIDLLILTHVDDDHIGGLLKWFEKDHNAKTLVKKVWFNSGRLIFDHFNKPEIAENLQILNINDSLDTSIKQGVAFEDYITKHNIWDAQLIKQPEEKTEFQLKLTFLSPDTKKLKTLLHKWQKEIPYMDTSTTDDYETTLKIHIANDSFIEDKSKHNGSSIAFILSTNNKNMVFLGDAHPSLIIDSLKQLGYSKEKPLKAEFLKVSHHGSKANTCDELLALIDTNKYIFSSNGSIHGLPHKQCIARIINHNRHAEMYFNYPDKIAEIFSAQDRLDFPDFKAIGIESNFEL